MNGLVRGIREPDAEQLGAVTVAVDMMVWTDTEGGRVVMMTCSEGEVEKEGESELGGLDRENDSGRDIGVRGREGWENSRSFMDGRVPSGIDCLGVCMSCAWIPRHTRIPFGRPWPRNSNVNRIYS